MIHVSIKELGELQQTLAALESALETLDRIGAGIAAIHVDAAIDQLRNNIEVVEDQGAVADIDLPRRRPIRSEYEDINPPR